MNLFRTTSLTLASWLIAENHLRYLRTEFGKNTQQRFFTFEDPDNTGPNLEREYIVGDPRCNAKRLNDAVRLLRCQAPVSEVRDAAAR